jgi:hypothetical protein
VRVPKHVVRTGKTPVPTADEACLLFDSIGTTTLDGPRDRTLIGVMTFAFARIGAVVAMRVEDYYPEGKRWWVRLNEKAASATRCRRTTSSKPISTKIPAHG